MTLSQAMTREELLEFAALDAFGLLDEIDADRYNRAFNDAPPTVQEEVRRVQAELAIDPALIAIEAEPPTSLRDRVLAAVAAAIEREEAQLAPLATIGARRHAGANDAQPPRRLRLFSASMFWRAACFVLAGAVIVLAYQWSVAVQHGNLIAELALRNDAEKQLREMIGFEFTDFVANANGRAVVLRPIVNDYPGQALLYLDPQKSSLCMMATGLPATSGDQTYTLRTKDGSVERRFTSNGVVAALRLDNLAQTLLASAVAWQVVDPRGEVVLQA